jgi:hypothetical protein
MPHGVRRIPSGSQRSGRYRSIPGRSKAKSIEVLWIRAEVTPCPLHRSDQASPSRTFICGEAIVIGCELPLYRSADEVVLPFSTPIRRGLQSLAQFSGEPYSDAIVFHCLSDILPTLSDIRHVAALTNSPKSTPYFQPVPPNCKVRLVTMLCLERRGICQRGIPNPPLFGGPASAAVPSGQCEQDTGRTHFFPIAHIPPPLGS